jgi:hypothetical protein
VDRGLWKNTVVPWMGEFGRTPRINPNAGRDHWARCWSVVGRVSQLILSAQSLRLASQPGRGDSRRLGLLKRFDRSFSWYAEGQD